jgi:hypothetical protein
MANGNRTTPKTPVASVAKATLPIVRPHLAAMDGLNQAIEDLARTVRALHAVDTHISDGSEDSETCRISLSRLLMADLSAVEAAERKAWAVVVQGKGGAL